MSSISSRITNALISPRRCACWPIGRGSRWRARRPRSRRPGAVEDRPARGQAWAEQAFRRGPGRGPNGPGLRRAPGSDAGERRAVPPWLCPGRARLAAAARRGSKVSPRLLEQAGLVARPEESPGLIRERFRGRLIFPIHDQRGRTIGFGGRILPEVERDDGRVREKCRKISEQPRDGAVPEAQGPLCGRPRPGRRPGGGLGGRGRGLHRRDRRAPGRAANVVGTLGHGPGRRPRPGPAPAGRPRGPGLRRRRGRARTPPTARWNCSWDTSWTSGC